ncbi:hypothetical protein V5799_004166 [Amblyomma americanum]|uniref:Uncharacterized protein n=1 Tax=Amblyomma americanum TaxID=6943 RepID=A0AAQ4D6W6_AMBAM
MGQFFLPNLAAVVAARVGERPAPSELWQDQLRGYLGYRDSGSFLISSAYVSGTGAFVDLYADKEQEITSSYATLGAVILRSILDSDATYFPSWARGHIDRCFAQSASSVLGRPVAAAIARDIMRFRWSAQLAWFLKSRQSTRYSASELEKSTSRRFQGYRKTTVKTAAKGVRHEQLFFRLLCFAQCGEPHATETCNDLTGFDRRFADVFGCSPRSYERSGTCDCYGVNNCETHLPASPEPVQHL